MEQTPLPTPQQVQDKINRNIAAATDRYQAAITNPNTLQPVMHPAESFFAPPSANPRLTTCLVCAAPFSNHADLCKHVELQHKTIYNPPQVPMPPITAPSPFAAPGSVFPLNPLQTPPPITHSWTPMSSSITPTPGTVPPLGSPPQQGKPTQQYRCNLCGIGCDTASILNNHLSGQKHKKKLELQAAFQKASQNLEEEGIQQVSERLWVCKLCTTGMENENSVLQHLDAVKHKRLRQNYKPSQQNKHLQTSPVTALQAAEAVASTPVSAALAVLKDDNVSLPPVSTLFSSPFPASSFPASFSAPVPIPPHPVQTDRVAGLPMTQPSQPGAPRASISKNPRPPPTTTLNKQSGPSFSCSVCSVTCNSMDSLNVHLASPRHKRKQNIVEAANNSVLTTAAPVPSSSSASSQDIHCKVCDVMICGQPNFESHLRGRQHLKKLQRNSQNAASGAAEPAGSTSVSPVPTPPRSSQLPTMSTSDGPLPIQPPFQQPVQLPMPTGIPASASGLAPNSTETPAKPQT